jgi:hypothetical protein
MTDIISVLMRQIVTRPVDELKKPFAVDPDTWCEAHDNLERKFGRPLLGEPGFHRPNFLLCGVLVFPAAPRLPLV